MITSVHTSQALKYGRLYLYASIIVVQPVGFIPVSSPSGFGTKRIYIYNGLES